MLWMAPPPALVKGKMSEDQVERVATQAAFDYLDVPQGKRNARAYQRLANIMRELGCTPSRIVSESP
jgi:hypothetical protein